jgi:hypothetical protein
VRRQTLRKLPREKPRPVLVPALKNVTFTAPRLPLRCAEGHPQEANNKFAERLWCAGESRINSLQSGVHESPHAILLSSLIFPNIRLN